MLSQDMCHVRFLCSPACSYLKCHHWKQTYLKLISQLPSFLVQIFAAIGHLALTYKSSRQICWRAFNVFLTNSAILPIEVLLQGKAVVDHGS
jgi:hypothetical protein